MGRAQITSLAGQQRPGRERSRRVLAAAEAGERRAVEARAHRQQRPGEEESKMRHKTIKHFYIIILSAY